MAWFDGTYNARRELGVSAEAAAAHFADPAQIVAATKGVAKADVDGASIAFELEEEDYGVVSFKAVYTCTYTREGTTVRWSTADGANLKQSGTAAFTPTADGAGCTLEYTETVEVQVPIPAMMAPALKPMVAPMLEKEVEGYLERLLQAL